VITTRTGRTIEQKIQQGWQTSAVAAMHLVVARLQVSEKFCPKARTCQAANPLDAEPKTDFNAKWPFKVIQGHPYRCQWRDTKGLDSTFWPWMWCFGKHSDGRTNGHLCCSNTSACIACYATALVKTRNTFCWTRYLSHSCTTRCVTVYHFLVNIFTRAR